MQHIYNIPEIEDWLPKQHYVGREGFARNFLDSLSHAIFKPNKNQWIDDKVRIEELKYINNIRNLNLLNRQKDYVNKQLKYYAKRLFNILKENKKLEKDHLYRLNIDCYFPNKYPCGGQIKISLDNLFEDGEEKEKIFTKADFIIYSALSSQKYKRLNYKQYSLLEKLVFEFVILLVEYASDKENCYAEIMFDTFWTSDLEKPMIELPDIK